MIFFFFWGGRISYCMEVKDNKTTIFRAFSRKALVSIVGHNKSVVIYTAQDFTWLTTLSLCVSSLNLNLI